MNAVTNELFFSIAAAAASIAAAVKDISTRRIPNRLTGAAAVFGIAAHWRLDGMPGLGSAALAGVLMGAIFLVLYAAGGMGAGDVKLMIAVGCLAGTRPLQMILGATVISGMLFAVLIAVCRRRLRQTIGNTLLLLKHHGQHGLRAHEELNVRSGNGLRMPFAVPIAVGCLISLGIEMSL